MRTTILISVLVCGFTASAFAQATKNTSLGLTPIAEEPIPAPTPTPPPKPKNPYSSDRKFFNGSLGLFEENTGGLVAGVALGYRLSNSVSVIADASMIESLFSTDYAINGHHAVRAINLATKIGLSKSFFLKLGAAYRRVMAKEKFENSTTPDRYARAEDYQAVAGIGNVWQIKRFLIGYEGNIFRTLDKHVMYNDFPQYPFPTTSLEAKAIIGFTWE